MTKNDTGPAASANKLPSAKPVITAMALLGFAGVFAFVTTEVVATFAAALWAATGLLHLGHVATIAMAILLGIPALWAIAMTARLAWQAEIAGQD